MPDFDPYAKWLNITPEERPISYYRLIDVTELESDTKAIKSAAEHRVAYLRIFQTGPHEKIAEELINKIITAAKCLLNPESKAEYDTRLRASKGESPVSSEPVPAPAPSQALPVIAPITPGQSPSPVPASSPPQQQPVAPAPSQALPAITPVTPAQSPSPGPGPSPPQQQPVVPAPVPAASQAPPASTPVIPAQSPINTGVTSNAVSAAPEPDSSKSRRAETRRPKITGLKLVIACSIVSIAVLAVLVYMMIRPKPENHPEKATEIAQQDPQAGTKTENIPDDLPEDMPEDPPEDIPEDMPEDIPEDLPEEIPQVPPVTAKQQQEFNENSIAIFDALSNRDFPLANSKLQELEQLVQAQMTIAFREKLQRLAQLVQYASDFDLLWSQAISQLSNGDQLDFGPGGSVTVLEITPADITISANGELAYYSLDSLSRRIELAILRHAVKNGPAQSLMTAGAHYATRQDTTLADHEVAREFWSLAIEIDSSTDALPLPHPDGDLEKVLDDNPLRQPLVELDEPDKFLVPVEEKKTTEVALVEELFEDDLKSATISDAKQQAASLIFEFGKEPVASSDELFAILYVSYTLARDSGERPLTDQIRSKLNELFILDDLSMRLNECKTWEELIPKYLLVTGHPMAYHSLATILEQIGFEAETESRYLLAYQAYGLGFRLNQRSTIKPRFSAALKAKQEKAGLAAKRKEQFEVATEKLKNNPDDPDANIQVGSYLAFTRNYFTVALPYLLKGSDPLLENLAQLEQANHTESSAMDSLGNAWRDYATSGAEPVDQAPSFRRAADWYLRAFRNEVSTLRKSLIQKKLDELPRQEFDVPTNGLLFFFPFNGDTQDESGNAHASKLDNPQFVPDIMEKENSAINFDGKSFLAIQDDPSFQIRNEFALSLLASLSEESPAGQWPRVLGHPIDSNHHAVVLGLTNPSDGPFRWRAAFNDGSNMDGISQEITSGSLVVPGTWTHLVYSVDRASCELWINGELNQSVTRDPGTIDKIGIGRLPFTIGSSGQSSRRFYWIGGIDSLRFYNRKLSKREIHSVYQVDSGQGIARSDTEMPVVLSTDATAVTNKLTMNMEQRTTPYRVDLPGNVDRKNLSLKVGELVGFPDAKTLTPNATAKAGKDVVINLVDNPSRVRIRLKLNVTNDDPYILVRSTFKLLANTGDTPLTKDHVMNAISATDTTLAKSMANKTSEERFVPKIQEEMRRYANSTAASSRTRYNIAATRLKLANSRIRSFKLDIPNLQRRRDRLQTLLGTITELHDSAVIHFEVATTPADKSE